MKKIYLEQWALEKLPKQLVVQFWASFCALDEERGIREEYDLDYIITLGGDGTVLHATRLIGPSPAPPLITFGMVSVLNCSKI